MDEIEMVSFYHNIAGINILSFQLDLSNEFNKSLVHLTLKKTMEQPDQYIFNGRNFTSKVRNNLFLYQDNEFVILRNIITDCFFRFIDVYSNQYRGKAPMYATCGVNYISYQNYYSEPHRHHDNPFNLTGIYFADGRFSEGRGGTRFWTAPSLIGSTIEEIPVHAGTFLLFQGTLLHGSPSYNGDIPRVVFPMDFRFRPLDQDVCPHIYLGPSNSSTYRL